MTSSLYQSATALWLKIRNTEPVTVIFNRQIVTTVESVLALRRALSRSDLYVLSGQLALQGSELVWNLRAADLGSDVKSGDTITDSSSTAWQVISCELQTAGSRWRCVCQKQK